MKSSLDLKLVNVGLGPYGPGLHKITIRNGVIVGVEPLAERVRSVESGAIDLMGCTVLPGIDDSHLHAFYFGRALISVDLQNAETLGEFKGILRSACADESGWIRGNGWDAGRIQGTGPGGTVCAADIDEVKPDVPVFLTDMTGHQGVGNSLVMRLAGISEQTVDPVGGSFIRDEHGVPSGLMLEGAVRLVNEVAPRLSPIAERAAILTAQENLLSRGITAFTDPGLGPGAVSLMEGSGYLSAVQAYRDLADSGELSVRVNVMLLFGGLGGTSASDVRAGLASFGPPTAMKPFGRLGISQLKIFADGIPRSKTAWVTEPYDDCSCGHLQVAGSTDSERVDELTRMVADSAGSGWQVGAHAIGDRTVSTYLDAVAATTNSQDMRHYVIHGDLVRHDELELMASLGVTMNSNPSIRWAVAAGAA
ncbi:MAG: amidohydrolase family protein, partial [Actinomycetota bacterium]|nr:amidohydrolase family protein [Actinomycetota bacterium]